MIIREKHCVCQCPFEVLYGYPFCEVTFDLSRDHCAHSSTFLGAILAHATAQIRPWGPCQPTAALAGPTFSYLRNPDPQAPHQLNGAQGGYLRPTALGSSAAGPPGHDRHGQFDSGFIYQQAGRDSLHFPATSDCRAFPLVRVTRHNSPGETHSRLHERDSRPPISSESVNTDRVVSAPRDRETPSSGFGGHQKSTCLRHCRTPTFLGSCLQFRSQEP